MCHCPRGRRPGRACCSHRASPRACADHSLQPLIPAGGRRGGPPPRRSRPGVCARSLVVGTSRSPPIRRSSRHRRTSDQSALLSNHDATTTPRCRQGTGKPPHDRYLEDGGTSDPGQGAGRHEGRSPERPEHNRRVQPRPAPNGPAANILVGTRTTPPITVHDPSHGFRTRRRSADWRSTAATSPPPIYYPVNDGLGQGGGSTEASAITPIGEGARSSRDTSSCRARPR